MLAAVCAATSHPRAQTTAPEPAYVARGRKTEAQQTALKARVEQLHGALEAALAAHAPDLLPQLELPPAPKPGYQRLPTLVPDTPPPAAPKPQVVSFYWGWSDTQLSRLTTRATSLDEQLAAALAESGSAQHERLAQVVKGYTDLVRERRGVDSDVDYNWFWQRDIVRRRAWYDERTRLLDRLDVAQRAGQPVPADVLDQLGRAYPPDCVRIEHPTPTDTVMTVQMITDVEDDAFIRAFMNAVERYWRVDDQGRTFRTRLDITRISPAQLYCGDTTAAACAPPAVGAPVDVPAHLARFPKGRAVLTTGAGALHVTSGPAVMLGPHTVSPRTLAHEFGHVLSFDDEYIRGYRDADADGFRILELILDPTDIMSAPGHGHVSWSHVSRLEVGYEVQQQMAAGLKALYEQRNGAAAVTAFERVLQLVPTHYGATLQLAKALDAAGRNADARRQWERVSAAAAAIADRATMDTASARLGTVR